MNAILRGVRVIDPLGRLDAPGQRSAMLTRTYCSSTAKPAPKIDETAAAVEAAATGAERERV